MYRCQFYHEKAGAMSTEIIAQWRSKIQSGSEELVQNPIMSVYLENLELVASESVARIFDHHQTIATCRIRVPDNPESGFRIIGDPESMEIMRIGAGGHNDGQTVTCQSRMLAEPRGAGYGSSCDLTMIKSAPSKFA